MKGPAYKSPVAGSVPYDNEASELDANNVQEAIDEIVLMRLVLTDELGHVWTNDLCPVIVG